MDNQEWIQTNIYFKIFTGFNNGDQNAASELL
jgi:hypothetical protein